MADGSSLSVSDRRALDDRIALAGVLQELTVAVLDLFDPSRSVDDFLQTLSARMGCRVALCVEEVAGSEGGIALCGTAGLARTSLALPLPAVSLGDVGNVVLPYPEIASRKLTTWVICPDGNEAAGLRLLLYYEREPLLARQYRGMSQRVARHLSVAFEHRRLNARVAERERSLRRVTDEVRTLNADLERRVAERTHELATTNQELAASFQTLRETQDRLALSDRMASIGTLAAGMAHEINNPLTYITANLELLVEEGRALPAMASAAGVKILEMASDALEGAERVRKIVSGLKAFSRNSEERREGVDLHQVLERAIKMTFNEIRHRARLQREFGEVPLVEADEARLGQVFMNLLVNAAQAIPEGRALENTIRLVTSTDSQGRAVVEVRDSGVGIAPEIIGRIFDPFFTTKAVGVGTGLGLAVCHGIVTALEGDLSVESHPGEGAVFRVVLRRALNEVRAQAPDREAASVAVTVRGRVLVIDDDERVGGALLRALKGHDVSWSRTGREGLEQILAGHRFDVILCDLMMPEMTGMDLHAELTRAMPSALERVIFMSGGAFTPSARAFLERITTRVVEKPFALRELQSLIQQCVDRPH